MSSYFLFFIIKEGKRTASIPNLVTRSRISCLINILNVWLLIAVGQDRLIILTSINSFMRDRMKSAFVFVTNT